MFKPVQAHSGESRFQVQDWYDARDRIQTRDSQCIETVRVQARIGETFIFRSYF